jgi:hypothetical protein
MMSLKPSKHTCCRLLLRNATGSFLLVGNGNLIKDLVRIVRVKTLTNVEMFEGIPKSLIPKLLAMADAGFIGAKDKPIYRSGTSANKIVDYMMAELPVISGI